MTGMGSRNTGVLDRSAHRPGSVEATSEIPGFGGSGIPQAVTTAEVLEVLGPDADDLLATTRLELDQLVDRLNAETTLLPPIDDEFEAEIEDALAGAGDERPSRAQAAATVAASPKWRKRMIHAAIGALLVAATGGATANAMNKAVTVDIDGQDHTVHTFGNTVGEVLQDEGITPHAHDAMSPSPNAPVSDGGQIVLARGKLVKVSVDGVEQERWTSAQTVGEALRDLNINPPKDAALSADPASRIPAKGMALQVNTLKHVTLADGAGKPRQMTTHAATVGDLLKAQHLTLGQKDTVTPSPAQRLTDGTQVQISRTGVTVVNRARPIAPPVKEIEDSSLDEGKTEVLNPGKPGKAMVTYRLTRVNGDVTDSAKLAAKTVATPQQKVVKVGTKQPAMENESLWDMLASCESTNNWQANTGNGYYGGLQFDNQTWLSNGGGQYAPRADMASKQQQIAVANRVKDARGMQPWECADSSHLDLE
jgi:uncharacterized protein YabE (DUF348 family)